MEVLIVSKTHMHTAACVGGLVLQNQRSVRLLNHGGSNQPADSDFEVGDIWDINFVNRNPVHPPHVEDVIITNKTYLREIDDINEFLTENDLVNWNGHIDEVFDGLLHWTNSGSGYIPEHGQLPERSTGFWISNRNLERATFDDKVRYRFPNGRNFRGIAYVGYQDTAEEILAGTILRLSLSRIYQPNNPQITAPPGYYLQLSGWYDIARDHNEDDFPF